MNGTDRDYFDTKFQQLDRRLDVVHDDVLVIKTERKLERKFTVLIAGVLAFVVSTIIGIFGR